MKTMEQLGWTKERFKMLYDVQKGFNMTFNRNSPSYGKEEGFYRYLKSGSELLAKDEAELVKDILKTGEE